MGQCMRVVNQQRAISSILKDMKQRMSLFPTEVMIVMDYKMKYVSKYYRQKSVEHFGKRGISWHGYLIICFRYDPVTKTAIKSECLL